MINPTISLEQLFTTYYYGKDYGGTYVYSVELLHIDAWIKEGWIEFVPTPQLFIDAGWPTAKYYKITETGILLLEFDQL